MAITVEELAARLGMEIDTASFLRAGAALEGIRAGFGVLIEVAKEAAKTLREITVGVGETAVEVSKAAQRTGVSTNAFQELSFAAEQTGVSADTLEHSLILLSRTAFNAAQGSKETAFTFRQLGVSMYDSHGKIRPTDELLGDLADRFHDMPDGMRKTALATQAFGRSGAQLLPFLNKGRAGIAELRKSAYDYGVVLDKDVIEAAERWEQQQKHLNAALKGLKFAIGGEFLKRLGDVTDKIATWIAQNRELIAGRLFDFLDNLKQLLEPIARILDTLVIQSGAWKYMLGALFVALGLLNLPLIAIAAALLAIEDFAGFLEGKDSVIGRYLFKDDATRKEIVEFMGDVKKFIDYLFKGGVGEDLAAVFQGDLPKAFIHAFDLKQGGGFADLLKSGAVSLPPAAVPSVPSPVAGTTNNARTLSVHQTINAAPGMDTKELADRSAQAATEFWDAKMRENYVAVDQ